MIFNIYEGIGTDIVIIRLKLLRCTCIFLFGLSQLYMMEYVPVRITAFWEVFFRRHLKNIFWPPAFGGIGASL
jgi:hypothetical protein